MPISSDRLKKLLNGQAKGILHDDAVKLYKGLYLHESGKAPEKLIEERRPSETDEMLEYRKKIYRSKTKNPIKKVLNSISKIRRSPDWSIRYNEKDFPKVIKTIENPVQYFEHKFPYYKNLTNWLFSICLKQYLLDANAVIAIIPIKFQVVDSEYLQPFPLLFNSTKVIEYKENDYVLLLSSENSKLTTSENFKGQVYWYLDANSIVKYEQNDKREFVINSTFNHGLNYLPAFKTKGEFKEARDLSILYESRIQAMVDHLDEAAREYSDRQAEMVQHVHSQKWFIQNEKCNTCDGVGKVIKEDKLTTCTTCKGKGIPETSPFSTIKISPAKLGDQQIPTPPAGYIEKDTEIVKVQNESIKSHLRDALESVNLEYLADVPLNQSGVAKEVDRDETNNFFYSVAQDLVEILRMVYKISIDMRYGNLLEWNEDALISLNPSIATPQIFDFLNSKHLIQQYQTAKEAQLSPIILAQLQMEVAAKKFRNEPEIASFTQCVFELDPLPGLSEDEKVTRLANKGITKLDYITSCNLISFVKMAIEENKKFNSLKLKEKQEVIKKLAEEKLKELDTAINLKVDLGELE